MTDLTAPQIKWLREEIGATPDDAALQTRYDELGSIRDVALSVLRDRRQKLIQTPLQTSVTGVAAINNTENVKALERQMGALAKMDDDPTSDPGEDAEAIAGGSFRVSQLVRTRGR